MCSVTFCTSTGCKVVNLKRKNIFPPFCGRGLFLLQSIIFFLYQYPLFLFKYLANHSNPRILLKVIDYESAPPPVILLWSHKRYVRSFYISYKVKDIRQQINPPNCSTSKQRHFSYFSDFKTVLLSILSGIISDIKTKSTTYSLQIIPTIKTYINKVIIILL